MSHSRPEAEPLRVALEEDPAGEVRNYVLEHLRSYNRQRAEAPDFRALVLAARQGDQLVGGLIGETGWRWLFVELLWVSDHYRRQGLGGRLLAAAEREAIDRGARHAYLDTFDFQSRPFYESRGYELFGTLEDYPPGHARFFLRKDLGVHGPGAVGG